MALNKEFSLGELVDMEDNSDHKARMNLPVPEAQAGPSRIVRKKRVNKNRPREVSSKIPVSSLQLMKQDIDQKEKYNSDIKIRDPRFDSLSGTFDEKFFRESYKFLDSIKVKEKIELEKSLKEEENPKRKALLKFLLSRISNEERERRKRYLKLRKVSKEIEQVQVSLQEGKKAYFKTKAEKKLSDLVEKYEELKKMGKLDSYFKRMQNSHIKYVVSLRRMRY